MNYVYYSVPSDTPLVAQSFVVAPNPVEIGGVVLLLVLGFILIASRLKSPAQDDSIQIEAYRQQLERMWQNSRCQD
jgi:hypothetical protein